MKTKLLCLLFLIFSTYVFSQEVGQAFNFNTPAGNNFDNYLSCGDIDLQSFSMEAWVKTDNSREFTILSKGNGNGQGENYIFQLSLGRIALYLYGSNAVISWEYSTPLSLPANSWTHVAVTFNSITGENSFYVNGTLNRTVIRTQRTLFNDDSPAFIGQQGSACRCNYYSGDLDEVRVWNKVLTCSEITSRMNCELVGNESGLVAYYQFNQGLAGQNNMSVLSVNDKSNNGYNAIFPANYIRNGSTNNFIATGGVNSGNTCSSTIFDQLELEGNNQTIFNNVNNPNLSNHTEFGTNSSRIFTIKNPYNFPIKIDPIEVSGVNSSDFNVVGPSNSTIAAKSSVTFEVQFTPSSGGTKTAFISVKTSNCFQGTFTFGIASTEVINPNLGGNNALYFDGIDDYAVISENIPPTDPLCLANSQFTIEAWIRPEKDGNEFQRIFGKISDNFGKQGYDFMLTKDGQLQLWIDNLLRCKLDSNLTADKWVHVAVTGDGNNYKMYVNGNIAEITETGTYASPPPINTNEAYIGGGFTLNSFFFKGALDELRIWNVARTDLDISNFYKDTIANEAPPSLVGYYKFNQALPEGSNTELIPLSIDFVRGKQAIIRQMGLCGPTSNFVCGPIELGSCSPVAPPSLIVKGNKNIIPDKSTLIQPDDGTLFGSTSIGKPISRTFKLFNTGGTALLVNWVGFEGQNENDFSVVGFSPTTIDPNDSVEVTVNFTPLVAGPKLTQIIFSTNICDQFYVFDIGGEGISCIKPEFDEVKNTIVATCNGGSTFIYAPIFQPELYAFRWQVENAGVFIDIPNPNDTLFLNNVSTALSGTKYRVIAESACGNDISQIHILIVNQVPAVITSQPLQQNFCLGDTIKYEVNFTPINSKVGWFYKDQVGTFKDIELGAIGNKLILPGTPNFENLVVRAEVFSGCGSTPFSNEVIVLYDTITPKIISEPLSINEACLGGQQKLFVQSANPNDQFLWHIYDQTADRFIPLQETTNYKDVTNDTLTISNIPLSFQGNQYKCLVFNQCNSKLSTTASIVKIGNAPNISVQPKDISVCEGRAVTFSVFSTDAGNYQWQQNAGSGFVNLADGGVYNNVLKPALEISNTLITTNNYRYRVLLSNSCGIDTSVSALLSVNSVPTILEEPSTRAICEGSVGFLKTRVTGAALNFQWQLVEASNFIDLADDATYGGTKTDSLIIRNQKANPNGLTYRCVIKNNCSPAAITKEAKLIVNSIPVAIIQGNNQLCAGQKIKLEGSGGSSYNWGNGQIASSIEINPKTDTIVQLEVLDQIGCKNSITKNILVNQLPDVSITGDTVICNGSSTTLFATGALEYIWTTTTVSNQIIVSPPTNTSYLVTGTDINGCINSAQVLVTVEEPVSVISQPTNIKGVLGFDTILTAKAEGKFARYQWQQEVSPNTFSNLFNNQTFNGTATDSLFVLVNENSSNRNYRVLISNECNSIESNVAFLSADTITTVWNGASWSKGLPTYLKHAQIDANFTISGVLSAIDFSISAGDTLFVRSDNGLIVNGDLINSGTILKDCNGATITTLGKLIGNNVSTAPPIITPTKFSFGIVKTNYAQQLSVTQLNNPIWVIESGNFPSGLTLGTFNGLISGIPSRADTFNFSIAAKQINNVCEASQSFEIIVYCESDATIKPDSLLDAQKWVSYSKQVSQNKLSGNVFYSLLSGALPSGLNLSGTGLISGTPLEIGTFSFSILITSNASRCPAIKTYTLRVKCPDDIAISPIELRQAIQNQPYAQALQQTRLLSNVTWSIIGTSPTWLKIDSKLGVLSGIPDVVSDQTITIRVEDTDACGTEKQYSLGTACDGVAILTDSLFDGLEGQNYNQPIIQTGLINPTWTLNGNLPNGLVFNTSGNISGQPSQTGAFAISVIASSGACTAKKSYVFSINCNSAAIVSVTPNALKFGVIGQSYSQTLSSIGLSGSVKWKIVQGRLPIGIQLDSISGIISGTTSEADTFDISVLASNGACLGTKNYSLVVYNCNNANITTPSLPNGAVNENYLQGNPIEFTGFIKPSSTILTIDTLPRGLRFSQNRISDIPRTAGLYSSTITATDGICLANKTYNITIFPAQLNIIGRKEVQENSSEIYTLQPSIPGFTYNWTYSGDSTLILPISINNGINLIFNKGSKSGKLTCFVTSAGTPYDTISININVNKENKLADNLAPTTCDETLIVNEFYIACSGSFINSFRFGSLIYNSNACGENGYQDFTATNLTGDYFLGSNYNGQVIIANAPPTGTFVGLWIDYNNNGDFSDGGEFLSAGFETDTLINLKNLLITNNPAFEGPRRVRVRCRNSGGFSSQESCPVPGETGEIEDYLIQIRTPDKLEAPQFISPNDDGLNDQFVIRGISKKSTNKLYITDPWGNLIFSQDNYDNSWPNDSQKGELKKGTYYYVFENGSITIKGFFIVNY